MAQQKSDRNVIGSPKYGFVAVILLPLFLLSACGDYTIDLPGGYRFISEAPDTQFVMRAEGVRAGKPYIPCNVVGYDYDANNIVAKQIARSECFFDGINFFNQQEGDAYFWIIDARRRVIHGPFSAPQFEAQRKVLGVSMRLKVDKRS